MTKKREKKAEALQRQNPKVDEVTRIRISQILEDFRASKDEVYKFDASLSNQERALVHQVSQKMGFRSKSSGLGKERSVCIQKIKKKVDTNNGFGSLPHFTFSEEAKQVLGDLFAHYPPGDENMWDMIGENSDTTDETRQKKDDIFGRPSMTKAEIANKLEALASRMMTVPNLKQITEERSKLPIASFKNNITSTVESYQVVLISGETGCGKTTQVPQFILDHMWGKGEVCKIVCTQPRRISATSVSERISSERGETIGENVGYKIRLESRGGRQSSIVLCTTGILLRMLVSKGSHLSKMGPVKDDISGITHIIMDEIHERDRYSDFMLAIIRDMLPSNPHLRLILMSATIDAARFSQYFGGCPIINVPGFTYSVKTFYLEDVLTVVKPSNDNHLDSTTFSTPINNLELSEEEKLSFDEAINLAWSNDEWDLLLELVSSEGTPKLFNYQHSLTGLTPLMVFAGKGRVGDMCMLLSLGADFSLRAKDGTNALEIAERENQPEAAEILKKHSDNDFSNSMEEEKLLNKYIATVNPELVDVVLIEQLIRKLCFDSKDGGILVFLPGWDDINRTRERLLASSFFKNTSKFMVISLHSMVPTMEQKKVFRRPPHGCRKIVLSTNIAETAITIDDIVYVIDTGRMKEKSYDPYNNVSTLQSSWISKASAKQREGRAGRCQPGICYHLYSKIRAASLPDFQIPEIRRMPIEELCLQVKLLDPSSKIEEFIGKTLDPPVFESIRNAIIVLQDIGALSLDEKLTQLGEKLGCLPVHPLISRMLFFAILMNCLDPALTLACASDYRDPFTLPMLPEEKKRATAAKSELASLYGGCGDQFAVISAFECWSNAKKMGLEARFCSQYFVSSSAMHMLSGMRRQLQTELIRNGFILEDVSSYSMNAYDRGILHAVLVAGLYPMVGRFLPNKNGKRVIIETASGDKVRLHSHSTNCKLSFKKNIDHTLLVYDEITRGDGGMNIRNCTVVGPLPLLLLSTEIAVAPAKVDDGDEDDEGSEDEVGSEDGMEVDDKSSGHCEDKFMSSPDNMVRIIMDRWLYFGSTAIDVAQLYCLRERLSTAILYKVTHPRNTLPPILEASIYALACILSCDGCCGIPVTLDGVDTLTTMVNATNLGKPATGTKRLGKIPKGFLAEFVNNDGRHTSGPSSKASIAAFKNRGNPSGIYPKPYPPFT
ncbi:DExH-box ATP-dependent RNA helicase DExH6-like [Gastrolobium bilobum]|uniref:DExH-box ATP-dependent RNA helicase DExH6-like n=1 Tax=Gastrolobium bilobum TaxID=150636 RepID=UPI002AB00A22|nr:DExH-box ATP-dependent RNA helicase DExH6-like [Gastrolobium bilobum]